MVKNLPAIWETWVQSLVQEDPLEGGVATHYNIHGQRSLAGYGRWGHKESNTTEQLTFSLLHFRLPIYRTVNTLKYHDVIIP